MTEHETQQLPRFERYIDLLYGDEDDLPSSWGTYDEYDYNDINVTELFLRAGFRPDSDTLLDCRWRGKETCTAEVGLHPSSIYQGSKRLRVGREGQGQRQQAGRGSEGEEEAGREREESEREGANRGKRPEKRGERKIAATKWERVVENKSREQREGSRGEQERS